MIKVNIEKQIENQNFNYSIETDSRKIALFGPSGSGKTTFLKLLAGLNSPDNGHININGNIFFDNKKSIPIHKRKVGYLPQDYTLFPHMNVEKNILYGVKAQKISLNQERFNFLINKLKISNTLHRYPHEISGGERQRAAIARAFLINPTILLLDEPFSALDKSILDLVQELLEHANLPAILVTHDLNEAINFAEVIAISYNGKIIEYGKVDKILNNPQWMQTARILQIKNIWDYETAKKFLPFKSVDSSFDYVAIKEEDIFISSKGKIKCKILDIKKSRFSFIIKGLIMDNKNIFINIPHSVIKHYKIYNGALINIDFEMDSLMFLKDYEKIFS